MKNIKWAICGLGRISGVFLEACKNVDGAEIVAAASSDKGRAEEFAVKHKLRYAYTYEELYNSKKIDAVYVATNMNMHCPNTLGLLANRIPVLCEKAFCLDETEAEKMIAAAKQNDVLLMEAMWTRFLPATLEVSEIINSGKLGEIKRINGVFKADMSDNPECRVFKKELGGGSLLDLGVYLAAYANMLLGAPMDIKASGTVKDGVDYNCRMELTHKNGVKAELYSSITEPYQALIEITCQNGKISVPNFFNAAVFEADGKEYKFEDKYHGFVYQIRHFCELLRQGKKESPIQTFEDTSRVMKVLSQAEQQL